MLEHPWLTYVDLLLFFFGMNAAFRLDAYCLFPHHVRLLSP